jgi:hypothetical protein
MVHKVVSVLPVYKINGKFYFRDARLGEYRNVDRPWDSMPIGSVSNSKLQKPTSADIRKVFGR